jgi:hypothetical protein
MHAVQMLYVLHPWSSVAVHLTSHLYDHSHVSCTQGTCHGFISVATALVVPLTLRAATVFAVASYEALLEPPRMPSHVWSAWSEAHAFCEEGAAAWTVLFFWASTLAFGVCAKISLTCYADSCSLLQMPLKAAPIDVSHIPCWRLSVAYLMYAPLVLAAHVVTVCSSTIVWSGVRFAISGGRVASMHRQDAQGTWYTISAAQSMQSSLQQLEWLSGERLTGQRHTS